MCTRRISLKFNTSPLIKWTEFWNVFSGRELRNLADFALCFVHNLAYKRERGNVIMAENTGDSNGGQNPPPLNSLSEKALRWTIGLLGLVVGAILSIVVSIAFPNVFILPEKINRLEGDVSAVKSEVSSIKDSIWEIRLSLAGEGSDSNISITDVVPNDTFLARINFNLNGRDFPSQTPTVQLLSNTVIGYRKGTDVEVTVEEISDCRILLPYRSGSQDVVFYGQINENGHWDGNCILNTYEGDKLILITDAVYDDGSLVKSKQVFFYNLRSGPEVWAYSDYVRKDGFGSGDTWLYIKESDYIKDFNINDATVENVLSADQFRELFCNKLTAYYSGNTSDGYFNDETGNAYMVYLFEDDSVRLLYCGNFVDGTFNDSTGNAWYIVRNEDTNYMYYKGVFRDGAEVHNNKQITLPPPLCQEQIDEILGGREFKIPLKWVDLNGSLS